MSNLLQQVLPLSWRVWIGNIPLVDRTWCWLTTLGKSPIRIVQSNGIIMEMPRTAGIDYIEAIRAETYEGESWKRIRKAITERLPGVFLDVGANLGWYSLQAAFLGRTVIAVEPAKDCLEWLRHNIELNPQLPGKVIVNPVAASDRTSTATLHQAFVGIGGHSLLKAHKSYRSYHVATAPLDDIVQSYVSVVKIDVEGNEPRVLAGMKRIINECHPAMSVECFERGLLAGGYTIEALLDILRDYGYTVSTEDGAFATGASIRELCRKGKVPAVNIWCVQ